MNTSTTSHTISDALFARQIALEEEMRGAGINRFRQTAQKAKETNTESKLPASARLLYEGIEPLAKAIENYSKASDAGEPCQFALMNKYIKRLPFDVSAYMTLKVALDGISTARTLTKSSYEVANMLEEELNYQIFQEHSEKILSRMQEDWQRRGIQSAQWKHTAFTKAASRMSIPTERWTMSDKVKIGMTLIDLLIRHTGYFELFRDMQHSVGKPPKELMVLRATEATLNWVKEKNTRSELLSPQYLPMLIEPKPWKSPTEGGYWSGLINLKIVKSFNRNFLEDLANVDMPEVYEAINHIQNTAWVVNRPVVDVFRYLYDNEVALADLPTRKEVPKEAYPEGGSKEEIIAWKKKTMLIHQENVRRESKLMAAVKKLWICEKFQEEERIYFPYALDFRGRAYPCTLYLHPQGDDMSKGVLKFADKKPIGEQGACWLAIHGANSFGVDKVSLQDRIEWTMANSEKIQACAEEPIGNTWWAEADSPWQFLAFCFEWAGFCKEGYEFMSGLPVAVDGSCNGLQHFSAMLRDEIGGAAVNLIPADLPSDIYSIVAEKVKSQVALDIEAGVQYASGWYEHIDRKLCKRPVMTMPYGSTLYGVREQLIEEIQKRKDKGMSVEFEGYGYGAVAYLAPIIWNAIGQTVVAARGAMDWLQAVSRLAVDEDVPISWATPLGFPVEQLYFKPIYKTIQTVMLGKIKRTIILVGLSKDVDRRKQVSSVSPNFVHSCDSAHMMRTVNRSIANGLSSFSMVHDSFATHACDVEMLGAVLRETFIELYEDNNVLLNFKRSVYPILSAEAQGQVPDMPVKGALDITRLRDSLYFFA